VRQDVLQRFANKPLLPVGGKGLDLDGLWRAIRNLSDAATPPWASLRGSDMPLIRRSELSGDELLGAEHLGLLDLSERQFEARQLSFSRRQFCR
jgi:hypothetical protein